MGKITVSGIGIVTAKPDIAFLSVVVSTLSKKSIKAREENNKIMNAALDILKGLNIESKDLQTSMIDVSPQHTPKPPYKIVGYAVKNNLVARIRDTDNVDQVIDSLSQLGDELAVGQIEFDVEEKDKLYESARIAAIKDAMEKVDLYCKEAGLKRVTLAEMSEQYYRRRGITRGIEAQSFAASASADSSTNVQAGEREFEIQISTTFEVTQLQEK